MSLIVSLPEFCRRLCPGPPTTARRRCHTARLTSLCSWLQMRLAPIIPGRARLMPTVRDSDMVHACAPPTGVAAEPVFHRLQGRCGPQIN
jgi:hypothetical protein